MTVLRRALGLGAVLLLVLGLPLVAVPRTIVEGILGQASTGDDVWIRLTGAGCTALALFHVLVVRKLDDLWWWCWAFVLFDGSVSVIALAHAAVGPPEPSAAWPWWISGAAAALFTAVYLIGLARAGREKPFA
jgi:hypothetical protein